MKKLVVILSLFCCQLGYSQSKNVKGYVLDGTFDEQPLAFAKVKVKGLDMSVETDLTGSYNLNLYAGNYTLEINFIGYEKIMIENVQVSNFDLQLEPIRMQTKKLRTFEEDVSSGR